MPRNSKSFHFEFSLEVLNHLGRGLYRSFATVVAEAISNAWDAEATEVNILIEEDKLIVEDNGKGMSEDDFQKRFLAVGYSRRGDSENKSKRNVIGRKGIGNDIKSFANTGRGTKIIFEKFKTQMNSEDIIRKYLATQFNFIFSLNKNDSFTIKVNNKAVTNNDLKELNENTQFLWLLGGYDSDIEKRFINLAPSGEKVKQGKFILDTEFSFNGKKIPIKGYIASVKISSNLVLRGSGGDFRAGLNLFTNGRLRQKDLIEDITTKGLAEEYLYGEIHVDGFEDENIDRFTSSREGIIKDDHLFQEFIKKLKSIIAIVINDWSPWRREIKEDWDLNHGGIPKYIAKMEQSKNEREKDFKKKIDETIDDEKTKKRLKDKLKELSEKNTVLYQDLYILENLFREYIKNKGIKEEDFVLSERDEKEIIDRIKNIRGLRKDAEKLHPLEGKIVKEEHYLNYTDLFDLSEIVDLKIKNKGPLKKFHGKMVKNTNDVRPVRNPVMHTNEITVDALKWDKIERLIDYMDKLK
ncbi:MAG: ATP-binding protein [Candidatus Taylorbacteria bacterium]|nr:ATP-binding protein [Candidatus Taylorbacteria bacterium]